MRVISSGARTGAAIFGVAVACCRGALMNNPSAPPPSPSYGITIRDARIAEHMLLTNMINRAFRHHYVMMAKDIDHPRVTKDGKQVLSLMETPSNVFLVAEESNGDNCKSVVGCVHVCWSGETDSKDEDVDAHFGILSVPEELSGRGIGRLLVSAAEERCRKELRLPNIVIEISVVSYFPWLSAWYEAQGYRKKGTIPYPIPEIVRDGCDFHLQLMTKTIP